MKQKTLLFIILSAVVYTGLAVYIAVVTPERCVPKGTIDPNCGPQDKWCKVCR